MSDTYVTPPVARGSVVAWAYGGTPQYGIVEGIEGDRVFVRRLDGTRGDRARLLPKSLAQVLELYGPEAFVRTLRDRLIELRKAGRANDAPVSTDYLTSPRPTDTPNI